MSSVKKYIAALMLAGSLIACSPQTSFAREDDVEHFDARVQGYETDVELKSSSVGMAWMLLLLMGLVCVGVIFKDAKRSHLD